MPGLSRRKMLQQGALTVAAAALPLRAQAEPLLPTASGHRPPPADRRFRSEAVEKYLLETAARIPNPTLAALFTNCFPNTLDTTVEPGTYEGQPDTVVLTGDIPAMWLRDSSAQVWPYLPLARQDAALRHLLEGVIRRQTRCLLIDTYANAFMANLNSPPLPWAREDKTTMAQGVGERKYELDSLCYPIRLAHGFWRQTGSTAPFDGAWQRAMHRVVDTMRVEQRRNGPGPYRFQRTSPSSTETLSDGGLGNPVLPNGLIASAFRPSDDACIFPFLVSSNLFAVTSLRQLSTMAHEVLKDDALANEAQSLAGEVERALMQFAVVQTQQGSVWAYEVDGYGSQLLMDDANVPSLLGLPYLGSSPDAALYASTRALVWSPRNPWFFAGSAGEGIGGPHEGRDMIWPMSQIVYALTSNSPAEIRRMLSMIVASTAGTGFIHESYQRNNAANFTRPWFAWANTLFGELVARCAWHQPEVFQ